MVALLPVAELAGYGSVATHSHETPQQLELPPVHNEFFRDDDEIAGYDHNSDQTENSNEDFGDTVTVASVFQPRALLRTLPLATLVFYSVSGGPFGSEASVKAAGNFYALLGFLVMPLVWSLPEAMVTAELGAAYPEASGGVAWVEEAFGKTAGWMEGYLKWVSGVTDNAIYPVLLLEYILQVVDVREKISQVFRFLLLAFTTLGLAYINWLGLDFVGNMSVSICLLSLSPFIILTILGIFNVDPKRWFMLPVGAFEMGSLNVTGVETGNGSGVGLFSAATLSAIQWRPFLNNLFWNLNSFDSAASFAGDCEDPERVFPRAMILSVVMVTGSYFLPLLVATGASAAPQQAWVDGYLATAASNVIGPWLGAWTVFAAGISNIGLFQAEMSSDAFRVMGMADRGFVPKIFGARSRWGTPTYGILLGTVVIVVMGANSFASLTEMLNFNYSMALLMEYAAFVKLRISKPDCMSKTLLSKRVT
jgi:amino acid transporter